MKKMPDGTIHPGCVHCYAKDNYSVKMHGIKWGSEKAGGTRVRNSDAYWREPLKWNRLAPKKWFHDAARSMGGRGLPAPRVFCASLGDVFEDWSGSILDHKGNVIYLTSDGKHDFRSTAGRPLTMDDLRADLFRLIDATPNLDWMLLTKRPENIRRMWPEACPDLGDGPRLFRPNCWLGTSCSDQETADAAIPELLKCRDLASVLFVSAEPLLGPIDFAKYTGGTLYRCSCGYKATENEMIFHGGDYYTCADCGKICRPEKSLDLVITGGESGPKARMHDVQWSREIGEQCMAASVAWFHKQHGSNAVAWTEENGRREGFGHNISNGLKDPKGGDPREWAPFFQVRQMPEVSNA